MRAKGAGAMSETADSCEKTWRDALEQCRRMLDEEDFKLITEFESPEKLLQEVQKLERQYTQSVILRLLKGIRPHLLRLQTFSTIVLLGIGSGAIKATCVWGATNLLIQLSSQSEQALEEISSFLNDLGNKFTLFEIYKGAMELDEDLLEAFFNLLVDLVLDSVGAIKHFRKNDMMTAVKIITWINVENKFKKTIKDLDSKVDHLRKLAKAQNLVQLNRSQARLAQQLAELSAREESSQQEVRLPTISIPFQRNPAFFGRSETLDDVRACLNPTSIATSIQSVALWGTAGIGKTQVALEFAIQQFHRGIQVVLWISSETEGEISNSFIKAANSLQPPGYSESQTPDQKRLSVLEWLQKTTVPWLLIFDNVEDEDELLQNWPVTGNGSILVTCRSELRAAAPAATSIEIRIFDIDESVELMLKLAGKADNTIEETIAARELATRVGGLAIALDILAKQIFTRKCKVADFLAIYNEHRRLLLTRPKRGAKDPYYSRDISTIWLTAFESMGKTGAQLLSLLCYAAPDEIPQDMLKPDGLVPGIWPFLQGFDQFEEAKIELLDLSLIRINDETGFIAVHRLTQEEYMEHMPEDVRRDAFQVMAHLLSHAFPRRGSAGTHHLYHHWQSCEQLIQHVIALQDGYEELRKKGFDIQDAFLTRLLSDAGWYLAETGSFKTCERMVEMAMVSSSNKSSLAYASLRYTAGSLNHRWGRYPTALSHYENALEIREMLSAKDSNELATSYSAVGMALTGLYKGTEALPYFEKAFAIFHGTTDDQKAAKYNIDRYLRNRSRAKIDIGLFEDAKLDLKEAELWQTRIYGTKSHYHGESGFELGKIALKQGDLDLAAEHFSQAYQNFRSGKPTHQCVMAALYQQGIVCLARREAQNREQNDEAALHYFQDCLAICQLNEPRRGDQGESARVKWQMAGILERKGQHSDAQVFRAAATDARRKLLSSRLYPVFQDEERSWDCFLALLYR